MTRRRRRKLQAQVRAVSIAAAAVAQMLLTFAAWIAAEFAIAPAQAWARVIFDRPKISAEMPRVIESRAFVSSIPPVIPQPAPIVLEFRPMPSLIASRVSRPKRGVRRMSREAYLELIREIALRHDVPAALVEAIVRVESDFDARALSPKGARGLMQVMPETGRRFGVHDPEHLYRPAQNLAAGTAYLAWLLKRFQGDLDLALAAYNAGEGAVDNYGGIPPYRETQEYVRRVRKALAL